MKKLDYVVIIIVLLIGASVFASYFNKFNIDTENAKIGIYFQDVEIDVLDYHENINTSFTFKTKNKNTLEVIKDVDGNITTKYIDIDQNHEIYNKVDITYDCIKMVEADCSNQSCMRMIMNNKVTLPIICTNGVIVTFIANIDLEVQIP